MVTDTTTDRELDARIDSELMGYQTWWEQCPVDNTWEVYRQTPSGWVDPVDYYTSNPGADYEVLRHVREKWSRVYQGRFADALYRVWHEDRGYDEEPCMAYEPGDWSRAAIAVIDESNGKERR